MKKILVLLFIVCTIKQNSFAQQDYVRPSALGISFIANDFITPQRIRNSSLGQVFNNKQFAKLNDMGSGMAIHYFKGVQKHIDFAGTLAGSFVKNVLLNKPASSNNEFLLEADAAANFKMLSDKYWFTPYIIAGVGASKYRSYYGAFLPIGGGVKLNLFDEAAIFITNTYRVPITKETNNYHFMYSFGIAGTVGTKKQPVVLPPPVVEAPPVDSDGDGIPDVTDQCPNVAGLAKYNGCPVPDTDGDGINDEEDKCKNVKGLARYQGCPIPDTDNDGINDEEDKCKDVPGVARYQGCPVPDTDGDGINDEEDKCPALKGTRENNGCPTVSQEVVTKVNYAAKNLYFATASAKLLPKSFKSLDEVAKLLSQDANLKLSIDGHTDNVGKAEYNQTLSENRAASVKEYLVKKGVEESRLQSQGFGLTQPIADNKTAAGRSKNRRVEMKLSY